MVSKSLTNAQLRTLCYLADDLGQSDVDLAFRIGWKRGNFSNKVMGPLEVEGYVTYSPPLQFGKPKKKKELEDKAQQFKIALENGSEIRCPPGRPRKAGYINYDKEGIVEMILTNITTKLVELDYNQPKTLKKRRELTRTLNEAKRRNESGAQIELMQSNLKKIEISFENMRNDRTLYDAVHKELEKKLFELQELDTE